MPRKNLSAVQRLINRAYARYRLSTQQFLAYLERAVTFSPTNGLPYIACEVCGVALRLSDIHIDHDHGCHRCRDGKCGQCVRGLLCSRCNTALGYVEDLSFLRELQAYLELFPERGVPEQVDAWAGYGPYFDTGYGHQFKISEGLAFCLDERDELARYPFLMADPSVLPGVTDPQT